LVGWLHISRVTISVAVYASAGTAAFIYLQQRRRLKRKDVNDINDLASGGTASLHSIERAAHHLGLAATSVLGVALVLGVVWQLDRSGAWLRLEVVLAACTFVLSVIALAAKLLVMSPHKVAWLWICAAASAVCILLLYVGERAFS